MPTVDFYMHIEHATDGNIRYINEELGCYRKPSSSASSLTGERYSDIINGYEDA